MLKSVWWLGVIFLFCVREVGGFAGVYILLFPKKGKWKASCSPRMIMCWFCPFPVMRIVGFFVCLFFSKAARNTGCGMEGGILPVPIQSSLLTGLRVLYLSFSPSLPLLVRAPTLWFHHHAILDCRELIFDILFFLTRWKILFYNLSSVISY